jgi:putative membrane protein insertion efficiency factor
MTTSIDDPAVAVPETSAATGRPGPVSRLLLVGIHSYQWLRSGRPTGCRYLPTCSSYAEEAIRLHGPVRGSGLALRRLARCHPWGGHGVDPVPDRSAP